MAALVGMLAGTTAQAQRAAVDPVNPTCPPNPNWSSYPQMRFTVQAVNGHRVLLAEGQIDSGLIPRLQAALRDETIEEIWLRSPGGDARIGNILWHEHRPVAVLDWEMAALGPVEVDVAWISWMHRFFQDLAERFGMPGIPDFLGLDAVAHAYQEATGHHRARPPLERFLAEADGPGTP